MKNNLNNEKLQFLPHPAFGMMTISDKEFAQISSLVYNRFGINLTEQKRPLVVARLQKLLRLKGFTSFQTYYDYVISNESEKALVELVNQISTNHTFFNRERTHFNFFIHTALPEIERQLTIRNSADIRVWSAGCSSGEEAYMLVMLMREYFELKYEKWDAGILATDISRDAIATAKAGVYPEERVRLVPEKLKRGYLTNLGDGQWGVTKQLKQDVTFRHFNLMNKSFPFKKKFHIIFCRNVMIYFDQTTREALVRRFHHVTEPGGYLFIGHSETLGREQTLYKYIMPAVYKKNKG